VKKLAMTAFIIFALSAALTTVGFAYGPARQTFAPDAPAEKPVFNSMIFDKDTDTEGSGFSNALGSMRSFDERKFVLIRECSVGLDLTKTSDGKFDYAGLDDSGNPTFKIEPGKVYEVLIYYHNNAKVSMNFINADGDSWKEGDGSKLVGPSLAQGAYVKAILPELVQPGTRGAI
jgi:hypothetical protein